MPHKNSIPEMIVEWIPFIFAIFLSCLGGTVNYLNRIEKYNLAFDFFKFCLEIVTSGFVGIVAFMLCDAAEFQWSYTAAIVAISGHMGTRALFLFERMAILPLLRRYGYENRKTETRRKKEANNDAEKPNEWI